MSHEPNWEAVIIFSVLIVVAVFVDYFFGRKD